LPVIPAKAGIQSFSASAMCLSRQAISVEADFDDASDRAAAAQARAGRQPGV
jgi:hypothetical protein